MTTNGSSKWTANTQLIIGVVTIAAVLIGWGYTFSALQRDTDQNSEGVARLTIRLEQNDSKTDQLDLRVTNVEKIADDAIRLRRELEATLTSMKSDIAVMKDILQRQEKKVP